MNEQQIMQLSPIKRLAYFICERESVRLKKEAGEPKPWTTDVIIQSYRFCNVRRADDKVSRWLIDNWYTAYFDHKNMLGAVALARFINLPSSLEPLTKAMFRLLPPNWELVKYKLRMLKDEGPIFNGAYMVRGNDGMDKVECVVDYYVRPLIEKTKPLIDRDSMQNTWLEIKRGYGMGSFMAGQIVADLRHAMKGSWKDCNSWAPPGPGSQRGMARVLGLPVNTKFKPDVFVKNLVSIREQLTRVQSTGYSSIPKHVMARLELHDLQSCCCEADKFERILWGEGRPKQKYPGLE